MSLLKKISVALLATLAVGCQDIPRYFGGGTVLAEAADRKLYDTDLATAVPAGMTGEDSVAFAERYIDRWVNRQLKLREAEQLFSEDERDIDSLVEEYRAGLLIQKFDRHLVERADTVITDEQIATYYKEHASDFKVSQTLVKGRIVRFPSGSRQAPQLRRLMGQHELSRREDLMEICAKNNFELKDFSQDWVTWSEYLTYLPILRSRTYDGLLATGRVQQMRDSHSDYYFEVSAVLRQGETEPQVRATETVRRILRTQRHSEIVRAHEERIYRQSLEQGEVTLYNREDQ